MNSVTFLPSSIFGQWLSRGYFSFLLKVSMSVCCFGAFACITLSVFVFMCCFKFVVINEAVVTPQRNRLIADVTDRRWTAGGILCSTEHSI